MTEWTGSVTFGQALDSARVKGPEAEALIELPIFDAEAEVSEPTAGPEAFLALWDRQYHASAKESERLVQPVLQSMALLLGRVCYAQTLSSGAVHYAQQTLGELLGLSEPLFPFQGPLWEQHLHPSDRPRCQLYSQSRSIPNSDLKPPLTLECRLLDHQEQWRWFRFQERVVTCDVMGQATQIMGVIEETTEQHQLEQRLYQASFFDPLTGLANRELLLHRLEQQLAQPGVHAVALILIDIDDFRVINSRFGHSTGDELLQRMSQRFKRVLRPSDFISRWDNDVLAIVLHSVPSEAEAEDWLQCLRQQLRDPFKIGPRSLFVSVGMGMASSIQMQQAGSFSSGMLNSTLETPSSQYSHVLAEQFVQYAEEALGAAKKSGKGGCRSFNPLQHEHNIQKFALEALLRCALATQMRPFSASQRPQPGTVPSTSSPRSELQALPPQDGPEDPSSLPSHGRLQLYYQPIIDLQNGKLEGFEALIRWQIPDRDLLSPKEFIPLAEETGLIVPLGQWVLHQACTQLSQWQQLWPSARNLTMSVNLSPRQLLQPNLLRQIDHILLDTGLHPQQLRLELTETVMMENLAQSRVLLKALRQRGISLSIDDFGTGYSSLSYLDRLPLNTLKIDRSFVQRMGKRGEQGEIVRAIVAMAQSLDLETVVEGIGTRQQVNYLRSLGCNKAQGSYFAMPLPAYRAIQWIAQAA